MWLQSNSLGSGNRWYKVRVRPQYGLMSDVGVPVFVDPTDASEIWIDWDAAMPSTYRRGSARHACAARPAGARVASTAPSSGSATR